MAVTQFNDQSNTMVFLSQVLHLKTIDVTESFFDLGGHSLAATYMLEQVYDQLNVELRVHELFQFPSIVELAKVRNVVESNFKEQNLTNNHNNYGIFDENLNT